MGMQGSSSELRRVEVTGMRRIYPSLFISPREHNLFLSRQSGKPPRYSQMAAHEEAVFRYCVR